MTRVIIARQGKKIDPIPYVRLLTFRSGEERPFDSETQLTHSVLAFLDRKGHGETVRELAKHTRMHRATVTKCLKTLASLTYATQDETGRWHAPTPADPETVGERPLGPYAFVLKDKDEHWSDRAGYAKLFFPQPGARVAGKRFTIHHTILFWTVRSFADQHRKKTGKRTYFTSNARLRGATGLHKNTVHDGLAVLKDAGLIVLDAKGYKYELRINMDFVNNPIFAKPEEANAEATTPEQPQDKPQPLTAAPEPQPAPQPEPVMSREQLEDHLRRFSVPWGDAQPIIERAAGMPVRRWQQLSQDTVNAMFEQGGTYQAILQASLTRAA